MRSREIRIFATQNMCYYRAVATLRVGLPKDIASVLHCAMRSAVQGAKYRRKDNKPE